MLWNNRVVVEQREDGFKKVLGGETIRTWYGLNLGYKEKGGVKDDF